MTYEFVLEERARYVVLGDGRTPKEAEFDASFRLMRLLRQGEAGAPISYKLITIKKEPLGDSKRPTETSTEDQTGTS